MWVVNTVNVQDIVGPYQMSRSAAFPNRYPGRFHGPDHDPGNSDLRAVVAAIQEQTSLKKEVLY